jgi:hypothetical protein
MKNTECTIYITTRRGRAWRYRREKNGWTQTGPTGAVHALSAEQLLSHILPPLAVGNPRHVGVRVEADAPIGNSKCKVRRANRRESRRASRSQESKPRGSR